MKKMALVAVAILAASMGSSVIAADAATNQKAAQKEYKEAVAKAKAEYDRAIADCKKLAQNEQSACNKDARQAQRKAKDAANAAYSRAMPKPPPGGG